MLFSALPEHVVLVVLIFCVVVCLFQREGRNLELGGFGKSWEDLEGRMREAH